MAQSISSKKELWREVGRNGLLSGAIIGALGLFCALAKAFLPQVYSAFFPNGANWGTFFEVAASLFGIMHILIIRNPLNYLGYVLGFLMALFLGLQFVCQESYDLVFLYLIFFVPFEIKVFFAWRKNFLQAHSGSEAVMPSYCNGRQRTITILLFAALVVVDYAFLSWQDGQWSSGIVLKICSGMMIASSMIAVYWMIYKKNEAWYLWVIYSATGLIFNWLISSYFAVVLFVVFLIINTQACVEWTKIIKENEK